MRKRIFGELELVILNAVRESRHSRGCTVRDVQQTLGREDKYTTVMTVMNRLVAKGELNRERDGLSYRYCIQKHKTHLSLFEKWRQKIFGGKSTLMIRYLLESGQDITEEEFVEIEKLIEQAKRKGKS